jgi:hypothetical protein
MIKKNKGSLFEYTILKLTFELKTKLTQKPYKN